MEWWFTFQWGGVGWGGGCFSEGGGASFLSGGRGIGFDGGVSKVSWKFHIPIIYSFAAFTFEVSYFLIVSFAFSDYRQNFTAQ